MNTPWSVKVSSLSYGLSFSGHSLVYTSLLNPLQFIPRRILFGDGGKNISCTVLCVSKGGEMRRNNIYVSENSEQQQPLRRVGKHLAMLG